MHPPIIILHSVICRSSFFTPFLSSYEFFTLWKSLRMYRFPICFSSSSPLQFRAWELSHTFFYGRFCWRLWCSLSLSALLIVGFGLAVFSLKPLFSREASAPWCGFRGMGAGTTKGAASASRNTSQKTIPKTPSNAPPCVCLLTVNLWICVFAKLHSCVLVHSHHSVSCSADCITLQFVTNRFTT